MPVTIAATQSTVTLARARLTATQVTITAAAPASTA